MTPKKMTKKKGRSGADDAIIGARLKTIRISRGMSQIEIAKKLGVTFQQIQKYESGTNRVSASTLFKLADILGVSVYSFNPDANKDAAMFDKQINRRLIMRNIAKVQKLIGEIGGSL